MYHGGSAPHVRQRALEKLAALVDPTLALWTSMLADESVDASVRLRLGVDILDRAGFRPIDQLKLSGDVEAPLEIIISRRADPDSQTQVEDTTRILDVPRGD